MFVAIIFTLLFALATKCADCKVRKHDFIVVGGGLAGCIVATRLSEVFHFKVLLIEAGSNPPLIADVPMLALLLINSSYDWNFMSTPQTNAGNRIFPIVGGKMLGGTGSLNTVNWFRGNKRDYDVWVKEGANGWDWNNLLPYFKKIEADLSSDANISYSGFNGPILLTNNKINVPLLSSFISFMKSRGYSYKDPADGDQVGYSVARLNMFKHKRQSTYTNYLKPSMGRKNLNVIVNALVTNILFNEKKEAIGVVYKKKNKEYKVYAKREVIISAGAINSPQLLMVSGIGPKHHLESFGINVLSDLPVGDNFHDRVMLKTFFSKNGKNVYNSQTLKQFFLGEGPLTNYSSVNNFGNTILTSDKEFPDVQLTSVGQFLFPNSQLVYQMWYYIQRPKSIGSIRLKSAKAEVHPLINPNYLNDEYDVQILIHMAKELMSISLAINNSQSDFSLILFDHSQCLHIPIEREDYWRCIVRTNVHSARHFCCSCRMGSPQRRTTVVDTELKVLGVKNLRVIDASVMPCGPSANIQAAVAMIAEKGSDFIKKSHSR